MPRIYIASLSDYNSGVLHGKWTDATDRDQIEATIQDVLTTSPTAAAEGSPAEEYAVHDYEGFGNLELGEYPDLDQLVQHAELIDEHDGAWIAYVNLVGEKYATPEGFADDYCGEWDSEQAFASNLIDDLGLLADASETIHQYFDYDAYARDLFMGDYSSVDSPKGIYVFRRS